MIIKPVTTQTGSPVGVPVQQAGQSGNAANANPVVGHDVQRPANSHSATGQTQVQEKEQESKTVDQAVDRVNTHIQGVQRDLQFSVSDEHGETIIKVIDSSTEEVIREIPPEELLELAERLEEAAGLLVMDEA